MYKITNQVKPSNFIDSNDIGKIIRTCESISSENIGLTNRFFKISIDDKVYSISLTMYPFKIIVFCSDGRKLAIFRYLSSREESDGEEFGSYDVCMTTIDLYFHINPKKPLMCRVTHEREDSYNYNYEEILKDAECLKLSDDRTISWKYLALHKEKLFTKSELNTISNGLNDFIKGITSINPQERINTLRKALEK
jgi:hypothetical protein